MNLFRKKNGEPLDASVTAGTRSANNVPIFIGGGLIVAFLLILAFVMNQRATKQEFAATEIKKPVGTTQFAKEVSEGWTGFVPPANVETKASPTPVKEVSNNTESASTVPTSANINTKLNIPEPIRPDVSFEERERIRTARFQAFEAGLKSRTNVETATLRNRPTVEQVTTDVRTRISENRQSLTSDPSAMYQARLAQLRGELPAANTPSASATGNNVEQFNRNGKWELGTTVEKSSSPYLLRAGFVIPAIMLSGINSNLPGQVMAQVSQAVYDTATGQYLLIPQGTRLIGTYNSDVGYGQERVLMAWQRLIFPNGTALDIQAMPGSDSAGMAGFTDEINNHYVRTFSSAFLLSGVIAAVSMSQNGGDDSGNRQRASDALSESLGQTLGQTMAQLISKNLNIAPTLQIRPGYRFNVMVTKDMSFEGTYKTFINNKKAQ